MKKIDADILRSKLLTAFVRESMLSDFSRGKAEAFEDAIDIVDELSESSNTKESERSIPIAWLQDIMANGEYDESKAAWKILKFWKNSKL